MNMFKKATLLPAVVAAVLLAGCATTAEVEEARMLAQQAMDAAKAADSHAKAAMESADRANACCAANTERLERAMERSMRK